VILRGREYVVVALGHSVGVIAVTVDSKLDLKFRSNVLNPDVDRTLVPLWRWARIGKMYLLVCFYC